jgi:glucose/arabinose dehydrogenase
MTSRLWLVLAAVTVVSACGGAGDDTRIVPPAAASSAAVQSSPSAESSPAAPSPPAVASSSAAAAPPVAPSLAAAPSPPSAPTAPAVAGPAAPRVDVVATGLTVPWDLAFLPDRRMLVTERPGRVRLVERNGSVRRDPVARVEVSARGEGGLLGLDLDPDFRAGQRIAYLYVTPPTACRCSAGGSPTTPG